MLCINSKIYEISNNRSSINKKNIIGIDNVHGLRYKKIKCQEKDDSFDDLSKELNANLQFKRWMQGVPRFRVRKPENRCLDQLLELTVVNERLAGAQPWEIRQKVEYLKKRMYNWELIYQYVVKREAAATLKMIEEANGKVEELLSEKSRETESVTSLKHKLVELQKEVNEAHEKLHITERHVRNNLERIKELNKEVDLLENDESHINTYNNIHNNGEEIKNKWYPVIFSSKLKDDILIPIDLMNKPWVIFRDENGKASCIKDECAHRACPLSIGKLIDGKVTCPYHGWEYIRTGKCVKMPSTCFNNNIYVDNLPIVEKDGFIWIWPGNAQPSFEVPNFMNTPEGFENHAELEICVDVKHDVIIKNLMDMAHIPFMNMSSFAKQWLFPELIRMKFDEMTLINNEIEPYPFNISFESPCIILSSIGNSDMMNISTSENDRHIHQVHVCLPSKPGQTRILYRMSIDFMKWAKWIPGADRLWKSIAKQVLDENVILIKQQCVE